MVKQQQLPQPHVGLHAQAGTAKRLMRARYSLHCLLLPGSSRTIFWLS
jgi:hypothetical protein